MRISGKRLAVAAVLWMLLCAMLLAAALPAAGESLGQTDGGSIIHIHSACSEKRDGIIYVTVVFNVSVTYDPGNRIWITVSCGGQSTALPLKEHMGEGYSVTLSGCLEPDYVRVELNGFMRGEEGELLGINAEHSAPVVGDRILKVHLESEQGCDLYLVGEMWELLNGYLILCAEPTWEELSIYAAEGNHLTTLIADGNGLISWNFTENGYPDGVYLVVERENGNAYYVTVPKVDPHGEILAYVVEVTPNS